MDYQTEEVMGEESRGKERWEFGGKMRRRGKEVIGEEVTEDSGREGRRR